MSKVLSRKNTTGYEIKFIYLKKKEFNQLFFYKKSLTKFNLDKAKWNYKSFSLINKILHTYTHIHLKYERISWINLICFHSIPYLLYII